MDRDGTDRGGGRLAEPQVRPQVCGDVQLRAASDGQVSSVRPRHPVNVEAGGPRLSGGVRHQPRVHRQRLPLRGRPQRPVGVGQHGQDIRRRGGTGVQQRRSRVHIQAGFGFWNLVHDLVYNHKSG